MERRGKVRLGKRTKDLVKQLRPKEIAVIDHEDLDALGAAGLVDAKVCAVINCANSMSGRYPNLGPQGLLEHGIPLLDKVGSHLFDQLHDGDEITIVDSRIRIGERWIGEGRLLTAKLIADAMEEARDNLDDEISKFVDNTMAYVQKEKNHILQGVRFPAVTSQFQRRQAVVVVRGLGYRDDLEAISGYIEEVRPTLVGVDGGSDALLEFGHKPDLIIGDMDSVSDRALQCGAELLVHAYSDGQCPGKERLERLGLAYQMFPAPGTSEDVAMLLAYEKGAELIVAVGTHSNLIDFLEKGRPGMASTFLTRMKIGPVLVDAKGVSKLYNHRAGLVPLPVLVAALVPIILFVGLSSPWRHLVRLLWLQLRLFVGGM